MNFILTLSSFDWRKYDIMLTIIDKFFKTKLLISDLNNWKANDWITALWKYLQLFNWNLSRVIIFDRNAKFRFDMWKSLFKATKIDLFTSIVYHSQIDEQSEQINQTIEIALRYLLISNSNLSWHEVLSAMQHTLMNTITFTKYSFNQTLCHSYSFCHSLKWTHARATVGYMKEKILRRIKTPSLYERFTRHVVDIKSSRRRLRAVFCLLLNHQYQEHTAIRKRSRKCLKTIVFSRRTRIVWKLTERRVNRLRFEL